MYYNMLVGAFTMTDDALWVEEGHLRYEIEGERVLAWTPEETHLGTCLVRFANGSLMDLPGYWKMDINAKDSSDYETPCILVVGQQEAVESYIGRNYRGSVASVRASGSSVESQLNGWDEDPTVELPVIS